MLRSASEVEPALQALVSPGTRELVKRQPLAARRAERRTRSVRDPEPGLNRHAASLELRQGGFQIGHPVDEHGGVALQMVGEKKSRLARAQPHLRDPGAEGLDREYDLTAEDISLEGQVGDHVPAGHVDEVERVEPRFGIPGRAHRGW